MSLRERSPVGEEEDSAALPVAAAGDRRRLLSPPGTDAVEKEETVSVETAEIDTTVRIGSVKRLKNARSSD